MNTDMKTEMNNTAQVQGIFLECEEIRNDGYC